MYDLEIINNNESYGHYLAPDIPDKVIAKLVKNFDAHLAGNSVVAFYDSSLFNTGKTGLLFTNDGLYYRFIGKAIYIRYKDINGMFMEGDNLVLNINNSDISSYTFIEVFNLRVVKEAIDELIKIDEKYGQSSLKTSGKVKKIDLPPDIMTKCNGIIHTASVACGGVGTGLAQIPASDNAVIVPIQIGMITALGKVFDLNITEGVAKGIIGSAGATVAGRTLSQFLVGWIPGIGNAINTATAAGLTEAIGWLAVGNFYERWIQDKQKGRFDGMKDGYAEASGEYERKLRKQAEEFISQKKDVERERDEYEKLINDYETYIAELEEKCASINNINEVKDLYAKLKNLKS